MKINLDTINSSDDWGVAFESQLRTKPRALLLADIFNQQSNLKIHISSPTRAALNGHGLGFMVDNIANWADMDVILLSAQDLSSNDPSSRAVTDQCWSAFHAAIARAEQVDDWKLVTDLEKEGRYLETSLEEANPMADILRLSQEGNLGFIILPDLDSDISLASKGSGDLILLDGYSPFTSADNQANDIAHIILHEAGHLRARHSIEHRQITKIIREANDYPHLDIAADRLSTKVTPAKYLCNEIEADFYALQMMNALSNEGVLKYDSLQRNMYLGHRALDAIVGGHEHMTAIGITSTGLRKDADTHGFYKAVQNIHGEFNRRGISEIICGESYIPQNPALYDAVKQMVDENVFYQHSPESVLMDQFLTAAKAFAPKHFGIKNGGGATPQNITAFNASLDY